MEHFDYIQLLVRLLPETVLLAGALFVLFLDQALARSWQPGGRSALGTFIVFLLIGLVIYLVQQQAEIGAVYRGMLVITGFTKAAKICLLILALASVLSFSPARFTTHIGEYMALVLMATVGMLLLASTQEFLTAFIALELVSLALYLLTAFNKASERSAEAALKYFLFGSVAAGFTLFGISLVFGVAGSTSFAEIAASLRNQTVLSPLLILAIVLTAIGFAFKMAAAPLHLWAPDAYQGAPIPSVSLIASGSKLAGFLVFFSFFTVALRGQTGSAGISASSPGWSVVIAAVAAVSILVGNLLAIAQTNFRRLLAYSAVAHAGYLLIAVLAGSAAGAASGVYYLFTYGLAVIGAFTIAGVLEQKHGDLSIPEFAALSRRSPFLALCLFIFILSLAGIPPLAGFFGKFYVFVAAMDASKAIGAPGLVWIVGLALAASAVSLYYYLQVLKQAFVVEEANSVRLAIPMRARFTVLLLAAAVVYLGCLPEKLNGPLRRGLAGQIEQPSSGSTLVPHGSSVIAGVK